MADGHPFDALGRILSEGGDIALANALARGNQRQEILLLARWRDWGASDSDIATVMAISQQAVAAGRTLSEMDPNDPINFAIVPTNPLLFGDDAAGLRFYVSTDYQLSTGDQWYRADFQFPDLYSPADILSQADVVATYNVRRSPSAFNNGSDGEVTMDNLQIQTIIGRF